MDAVLYAARFIHYAAGIQLFGLAAFQAVLAPAGLRQALDKPSRRLAWVSAAFFLLGGLLWLAAQAGSMGEGWSDALNPQVIAIVLSETAFGHAWGWHLGFCVLALLALVSRRTEGWLPLLLLSTLALGSLGLVGHAAIDTGLMSILNRSSQILHLLSSGFWVGSLVPLLYCLVEIDRPDHAAAVDLALRRFSGLGHLAVAIVLGTGVSNTWFILRGGTLDPGSAYQQLLGAKILIAMTMVGLAVVNRYVFVPRIPNGGPGARQLARGTIAEMVLSAALIGIVSILGTLPPK